MYLWRYQGWVGSFVKGCALHTAPEAAQDKPLPRWGEVGWGVSGPGPPHRPSRGEVDSGVMCKI